jgi:hypothetical protein
MKSLALALLLLFLSSTLAKFRRNKGFRSEPNIMVQLEGFQTEDQSQKADKFSDQTNKVFPDQQGQIIPNQPQGLPVVPGIGIVGLSPRGINTYGNVYTPSVNIPFYDLYNLRRMRGLYY